MKDIRTTKEILNSFSNEDVGILIGAIRLYPIANPLANEKSCEIIERKLEDLRELNFCVMHYDD